MFKLDSSKKMKPYLIEMLMIKAEESKYLDRIQSRRHPFLMVRRIYTLPPPPPPRPPPQTHTKTVFVCVVVVSRPVNVCMGRWYYLLTFLFFFFFFFFFLFVTGTCSGEIRTIKRLVLVIDASITTQIELFVTARVIQLKIREKSAVSQSRRHPFLMVRRILHHPHPLLHHKHTPKLCVCGGGVWGS